MPQKTLDRFNLLPGQLRENIIIEGGDIHSLDSGTVIKIGDVRVRLTYHCEPCGRIKEYVSIKKILHQRGYLGSFLDEGTIQVGDVLTLTNERLEKIPYDLKERIRWYLNKQDKAVTIKKLAYDIGLSPSYYRAIPNMLKKMEERYQLLVNYPSKKKVQVEIPFDREKRD